MNIKPWIVPLALVALLAACEKKEAPLPERKAPEGRAETQSIRNTQAVGYDGKAIADKVDEALKKNDENVRKAEQQSTESP